MDFDPEAIYQKLSDAGEEWADADAGANLLEETKKTLLAELKQSYTGSDAERERNALATAEYKLHLKNMVAARKWANRAKVRYDAMRVLAEMRRTQESTRRAEANIR